MTVALYPGSFDPFHLGHRGIVERAAALFDEVVVAVVPNPGKDALLPLGHRVALVQASTADLANVRCAAHSGLTVDAARAEGADVIIRAGKEPVTELTMAATNERMAGVRTVVLPLEAGTAAISSTLVRRLAESQRFDEVRKLVPEAVLVALVGSG